VDVLTIHPGYVDGCHALDICSDNSHRDGVDIGDGPVMPNRREIITALILMAIIVMGNMGGLWLAGSF